jgi:hypothetical protein
MSNYYITSNNQTLNDIFKPLGIVNSDTAGNTGIQFTVISTDTNPLTVQSQLANNLTIQTAVGSTGTINILPSNTLSVSVGSTGIWFKPNNSDNITMYSASTICSRQFNYGSLSFTPTTNEVITLKSYDPRNIFIQSTTNNISFNLKFPSTPPNGTTFRIIKVPYTVTHTFTITLQSDTTTTFVDRTYVTMTTFTTLNTVYECTYFSSLNKWFCSSY